MCIYIKVYTYICVYILILTDVYIYIYIYKCVDILQWFVFPPHVAAVLHQLPQGCPRPVPGLTTGVVVTAAYAAGGSVDLSHVGFGRVAPEEL